jgi:hypothetical protein
MLEFLKTSTGVYNLSFIIALIGWGVTGIGIVVGFHLNKVKSIEAEDKARNSEAQRIETVEELRIAKAEAFAAKKLADDLEAKQQPRRLPPDVVAGITALASQATEKNVLQITCVIDDPEAWALAEQIKAAYVASGFTFERIVPTMTTPPIVGISVASRDLTPGPLHTSIAALLSHFGKPPNASTPPEHMTGKWFIQVGRKP